MKKIIIIYICICAVTVVSAKSMKELWVNMPDSLLPYLNAEKRMALTVSASEKIKTRIDNLLEGHSTMDTLTADYLRIRLNESTEIQLKRLPVEGADSIICMVKTCFAPEAESEVAFYSQSWKYIGDMPLTTTGLIIQPDTMTTSRFEELKGMIDPQMVKAELSTSTNTLVLNLSLPLLTSADKSNLRPILQQRTVKWNGKTFN